MNTRLNNLIASGIAFVGAFAIYYGVADEATWAKLSGALATLVAVVLPFIGGGGNGTSGNNKPS